jgi:hypothetical protein
MAETFSGVNMQPSLAKRGSATVSPAGLGTTAGHGSGGSVTSPCEAPTFPQTPVIPLEEALYKYRYNNPEPAGWRLVRRVGKGPTRAA